ncbi:MAG TPA: hypothetical protein VM487_01195 [Phycisphaerae bacterium]|nr:hypothetical protein [Phycisphaerae bacterium]
MLDVPERFFGDFVSEFPSEDTLADVTNRGLVFGQASLANVVKYTTWETARRIEAISIPQNLQGPAGALFANFGGYMAGIGSMQSLSVPDVLLKTGEAFAGVASALGAFESVPIVGTILQFVMSAVEGGIAAYGFANTVELEAHPMGYSKARDQDWTRASLKLHHGTDLTSMFLPANNASQGVGKYNTEVTTGWTGSVTEIERAIYAPEGPATSNIGGLPNTPVVPKGVEMNMAWNPRTRPQGVPWSHFMPSTSQAVLASWQSVLSNSRACYLVDAVRVERAWSEWQDHMQLWGWGTRYSGNDRIRISMMSRPPVDYHAQQRISADGFRRLVPFWSGKGMTKSGNTAGSTPHYGPLLGDVGAWAAKVQLGRRQRKYLGTLTVAYCSEADPAFASDPMLADLLRERRLMLLDHPAVVQVDLSQVVDADYANAVAHAQQTAGPGGIADAPKPGPRPEGPGTLAAPKREDLSATMPPVLVNPPAAGRPFLGGSRGESFSGQTGDAMRNAAVLALLGFLVR